MVNSLFAACFSISSIICRLDHTHLVDDVFHLIPLQPSDEVQTHGFVQGIVLFKQFLHSVFADVGDSAFPYHEIDLFHGHGFCGGKKQGLFGSVAALAVFRNAYSCFFDVFGDLLIIQHKIQSFLLRSVAFRHPFSAGDDLIVQSQVAFIIRRFRGIFLG